MDIITLILFLAVGMLVYLVKQYSNTQKRLAEKIIELEDEVEKSKKVETFKGNISHKKMKKQEKKREREQKQKQVIESFDDFPSHDSVATTTTNGNTTENSDTTNAEEDEDKRRDRYLETNRDDGSNDTQYTAFNDNEYTRGKQHHKDITRKYSKNYQKYSPHIDEMTRIANYDSDYMYETAGFRGWK